MGRGMKQTVYEYVFLALKEELKEEGYDSHRLDELVKDYSWFLSEYSLLRALLRSKLPIGEYRQSLDFLLERHEVLAKKIKPRSTVLDVGCGVGLLVCLLAKKKCRAYGIDTEQDNLRVATRLSRLLNVEKLCTFQEARSNTLSFDTSFDYVVLSWTLHDIKREDREPLLSQCIQILKPRGKLFILDPESQLNFAEVQEIMSRQPVRRTQLKTLSTVYDHATFTDAMLLVYRRNIDEA